MAEEPEQVPPEHGAASVHVEYDVPAVPVGSSTITAATARTKGQHMSEDSAG